MKSLIVLLISIFIETHQFITVETTINGKNYLFDIEEGLIILEQTEIDAIELSSEKDRPVLIVKSILKLGPDVKITKEINPEEMDPERESLGLYSAIIVLDGGTLIMKGSTIETNCNGCNAITVIGNGEVNFFDGNITTLGDNSAGLYANYGGKIITDNTDIETHGKLSPNLLVKNSGEITASNMNLKSIGSNSPLIYSNGNIMTSSSDGKAEKSKMVIMEGECTCILNTCELEGNEGVMIFNEKEQEGKANFESIGSKIELTEKQNPLFLVANSVASITLIDSEVCGGDEILINAVSMEEYGEPGSNGAEVIVKIEEKNVEGKAFADNKSSIIFEIDKSLNSDGITTEGNVNIK